MPAFTPSTVPWMLTRVRVVAAAQTPSRQALGLAGAISTSSMTALPSTWTTAAEQRAAPPRTIELRSVTFFPVMRT